MNKQELIIKPHTQTFKLIKDMLRKEKPLYFFYALMGVADKLTITKSGKLGFSDMLDNRRYLTQEEFNRYNQNCNFYEIIRQED